MLSELQKTIIGGLKLCNLQQDDIVAVMLMLLDNEEAQWEMAEYLDKIVDDPPDKTEIFHEAVKISRLTAK